MINYIRGLDQTYQILEVVYDPRFFEVPALMLQDEGIATTELPQSPSRMSGVVTGGYDLIVAGSIVHDGDPTLADHVTAAVRREYTDYWTLSKGRSKRHIDACIAMLLAIHRLQVGGVDWTPKPPPRLITL